jgi:hypothetical protein
VVQDTSTSLCRRYVELEIGYRDVVAAGEDDRVELMPSQVVPWPADTWPAA